jgi:hypothetical protein
MNIELKSAIRQHAKDAAIIKSDCSVCRYSYGSEERSIWIDSYCEQAELMEESA